MKVKAEPKFYISKAAKPKRTVNITKTGSVKSAIEGVVFIDIPKEYTVFIGEEITISKNTKMLKEYKTIKSYKNIQKIAKRQNDQNDQNDKNDKKIPK